MDRCSSAERRITTRSTRDRRDQSRRAWEDERSSWRAATGRKTARLLEGLSLEKAKDLVRKWDEELPDRSRTSSPSAKAAGAKRNSACASLTAVAAVMAILAVRPAFSGFLARQQEPDRGGRKRTPQAESERAKSAEAQAERSCTRPARQRAARRAPVPSRLGRLPEMALALAVESVRIAQQAGGELPLASLAALQHAASTIDTIVSVLSDSGPLGQIGSPPFLDHLYRRRRQADRLEHLPRRHERSIFGSQDDPFPDDGRRPLRPLSRHPYKDKDDADLRRL